MRSTPAAILASLLSGLVIDRGQAVTALPVPDLASNADVRPLFDGFDARVAALERGGPDATALATDTLQSVAPLAGQLGLSEARAALEDASFRVLDPVNFDALAFDTEERLAASLRFAREIADSLALDAMITGRGKSRYSTFRKMHSKQLEVHEVLDRVAVRLRVDDVGACYAIMDEVSARLPTVAGSVRDYIAAPKANGYQSLHRAVVLAGGPVEVQVRTHAMHDAAEHGAAAHWRYKALSA